MKPRTLLCTAALVFFLPYSAVANEWRGLVVAPEERCAPYNADEYSYPQSVEPKIADRLGGVYSPYTCETFRELTETDIEHIVARSEAHDSGLCSASPERKREFARDIRNLTLSAPHLNRNLKGAKDAADWTPEENRCWFAWRVIDVRRAYDLTIDRREADALDAILETCPESSPDTLPACQNFPKENKGNYIRTSRRSVPTATARLVNQADVHSIKQGPGDLFHAGGRAVPLLEAVPFYALAFSQSFHRRPDKA